jgi:hypothetical protein
LTTAPGPVVRRGPSGSPQPPPQQAQQSESGQADLRRKRRHEPHANHLYTGDWSLAVEVAEICQPLAQRVAARPNPGHYSEAVHELIDAVCTAVRCAAITMIARAAAERRVAALPVDRRGAVIRRLLNETPRPRRPDLGPAALAAGTWASVITDLARPYSGPLSDLLATAASDRRGWPTASQQLEEQLRVIDTVALSLQRKLDAAESRPAVARPPRRAEPVTQEQCRQARRAGMHFDWPREWDLEAEVEAICCPLETAVAALSDPGRASPEINKLVDTVYETVVELAALTTRADAAARVAAVPVDQRGTARKMVLDLAPPPPPRPVITEAALVEGDWVALLAELAMPYSRPLWELLAVDARIGGESVSDRLDTALTRIDSAALNLTRRIERIEAVTLRGSRPAVEAVAPGADKADKARAELSRLGVRIP